ncbi:MAG TPA: hypothetical protein DIC46_09870, partial [Porphyromonadaceae bacterium]|nr:hypothetical protein [Porphyromonadaceae bacterium]
QVQHLMIMEAYLQYLKIGFKGAYLASPYLKQKGNGLWESGVAHFIFPSEQEPGYSNASFSKAYDKKFGDGATNMFLAFMESYKQAFIEAKMRMPHYLGFDVRTRSDIQNLAMYFMAFGSDILCLRANLREKDVAWQILAKSGINKVYHLPAVPMTINELDLDIAKGRIQ